MRCCGGGLAFDCVLSIRKCSRERKQEFTLPASTNGAKSPYPSWSQGLNASPCNCQQETSCHTEQLVSSETPVPAPRSSCYHNNRPILHGAATCQMQRRVSGMAGAGAKGGEHDGGGIESAPIGLRRPHSKEFSCLQCQGRILAWNRTSTGSGTW